MRSEQANSSKASSEIFVLDVDSGQPIFNLPGTLALHKVDKQARSVLPETDVIQQTFIDSANPAVDPDSYIILTNKLVETFLQQLEGGN